MHALFLALIVIGGGWGRAEPAAQPPGPLDRKVAIDLRQVPLRTVLERLFHGSELTFAVTPGVPDVLITLKFRDTRLEDAIRALIETASTQVPGISAAREHGVYLIRIAPLVEPPESPPDDTQAAEEPIWEKIPLNYLDAGAVAVALGGATFPGPPPPPRPSSGLDTPPPIAGSPWLVILGRREDNSLVVRGTPTDIAELRRLLALFDTPPRQFRLRVSSGGVTAETLARQGQSARLARASGAAQFDLTLTPRLEGDGHISLTVEGTLTRGGVTYRVRSGTRLAPGRSADIASLGRGARGLRLWVRASVVTDPDIATETL